MHKIRKAMQSSGNHSMQGNVHVDEFVVGGKEKGKVGRSYHAKQKKAICAVELTEGGKVRGLYSQKIDNFSAKELKTIFDAHIDKNAKGRIVSIGKDYLRTIVRGKEIRAVEFEAKVNNFQIDGISFIEHLSFNEKLTILNI